MSEIKQARLIDGDKLSGWINRKYERSTDINKADAFRDVYLSIEAGSFDIPSDQGEAARLREALNKIGLYCAGTEFDHVSKFVLKALSSHTEDARTKTKCLVCNTEITGLCIVDDHPISGINTKG
jgi:hypothetical protein